LGSKSRALQFFWAEAASENNVSVVTVTTAKPASNIAAMNKFFIGLSSFGFKNDFGQRAATTISICRRCQVV
jgi:hypothetical protein